MSALVYLVAGMALLDESDWDRHYDLTFSLWLERAECEYLTGQLTSAEARLSLLSTRARTIVDSAAVTCARLNLYTTLGHSDSAVEVGLNYLRQVDDGPWPLHVTADVVRQVYDRLLQRLGSGSIESLVDLPLMTDPDRRATMDVLTMLTSPALFTNKSLPPGRLSDGGPQPGAWQQRRIVPRLCVVGQRAGDVFSETTKQGSALAGLVWI